MSFNKRFRDVGLSAYLNYSHQTYWNSADNDRVSLSLSRYVDLGPFRNMSVSLTAYRSEYYSLKDDGAYISVSLPIGNGTSLSYGATINRTDNTHRVSYYGRVDEHNSFGQQRPFPQRPDGVRLLHRRAIARRCRPTPAISPAAIPRWA